MSLDQTWRDETACLKSLGLREKCWGELVLGGKDYARHTEMKIEDGLWKVANGKCSFYPLCSLEGTPLMAKVMFDFIVWSHKFITCIYL